MQLNHYPSIHKINTALGRLWSSSLGSNRPARRNASRLGISSEDNRQLAHKSFTTSSRPDSSRPLEPETNSNSRAILPSSSSHHNRNSLSRANGSWVTKSFSTPSTSSQLTPRGPPIQPRRSNPTIPVWKPGQGQPQRAIDVVIYCLSRVAHCTDLCT